MQLAVNISLQNILTLISQMSLDEIEEVKNKIVEKELYFKTFKKDKIENIILAISTIAVFAVQHMQWDFYQVKVQVV